MTFGNSRFLGIKEGVVVSFMQYGQNIEKEF